MNPMPRVRVLAMLACVPACSLIALYMALHRPAPLRADDQTAERNEPKKTARRIPLVKGYALHGQEKFMRLPSKQFDDDYARHYESVYKHAMQYGGPNIFLVAGSDIKAAIRSTNYVFRSGSSVGKAVVPPEDKHVKNYWLVVHFGISASSSNPPTWPIRSAFVTEDSIRVTYESDSKHKVSEHTTDDVPYLAWIPVGKLAPGSYLLVLHDDAEDQVTLARRVKVDEQ